MAKAALVLVGGVALYAGMLVGAFSLLVAGGVW